MAENRYPAFPSRMQLQVFKNRTRGARKGHSLLKRKSDALKARLTQIVKEIYQVKLQMNDVMKAAAFSHTEAYHAAGDFNGKVITKVESATTQLAMRTENVVGVRILQFVKVDSGRSEESLIGLSRGGSQIRKCKDSFDSALELLVKLASLQTSFRELDVAMRVTNRRVQALDNVVIPKLENTMYYIASELDESEREDLYRLKKVVQQKKKTAAIEDAVRRAAEAKAEAAWQDKHGVDFSGTLPKAEPPKAAWEQDEDQFDPDDDVLGEL